MKRIFIVWKNKGFACKEVARYNIDMLKSYHMADCGIEGFLRRRSVKGREIGGEG
ncbi:MAG: hypothetical protein K1W13_14690 [Lachnospiraceae bacterium]